MVTLGSTAESELHVRATFEGVHEQSAVGRQLILRLRRAGHAGLEQGDSPLRRTVSKGGASTDDLATSVSDVKSSPTPCGS